MVCRPDRLQRIFGCFHIHYICNDASVMLLLQIPTELMLIKYVFNKDKETDNVTFT